MDKFAQQISEFRRNYEKRLRAVARGAVQDTIELAQIPRGRGGRMPIVTGFLRASIQASLSGMPSGPTANEGGAVFTEGAVVAGEPTSVTLLKWDPNKGTPFFVGWTAAYARRLEYGFTGADSLGRVYNQEGLGYLRGATELWVPIVEGNARHVREKLG